MTNTTVNTAPTPQAEMPDASEALVCLRGVDKTFANQVVALSGLNLDIRPGEFLTLLGPSGCGKSTVLRLLAGLMSPTAGEMRWNVERPEFGFVFQDATLTPWSDVFSNVWLPLRLAGVSKQAAKDRVEEALAKVGLSGFAKAYPRQLSGGMKMRVSIARALVTRPTMLLMDEPFAALDEITRLKLNVDLAALQGQIGSTVVFVTHSVFESVLSVEPDRRNGGEARARGGGNRSRRADAAQRGFPADRVLCADLPRGFQVAA